MAGNYSSRYYKSTYRKNYRKNYRKKAPIKRSPRVTKDLYTKGSVKAADLSGFDKSIYKVDKIIGQIGHGFDVVSKPAQAVFKMAKKIMGF